MQRLSFPAVALSLVLASITLALMMLQRKGSTLSAWRIRSRNYEYCSKGGMTMLTEALRSHPDELGLRPWWPGKNTGSRAPRDDSTIIFPGLDERLLNSAFRGRRIVFFGDSTMFYLVKWLHLLMVSANSTVLSRLSTLSLGDAIEQVNPSGDMANLGLPPGTTRINQTELDGTFIAFTGFIGPSTFFVCEHTGKWNIVLDYRPDILVVNFGLHWLHFTGAGRDVRGCVPRSWLSYESWLERAVQVAQQAGAKILLFKTTNLVCADKYDGAFATAHRLYTSGDTATLDKCREVIGRDVPTAADADNYCQNATFNEVGASHLNERIIRFVEGRRRKNSASTDNDDGEVILGVWNDHDVETCEHTAQADGRHYHTLNLLRIRLLGNVLQCFMDTS